jgi:cell division FtsZ-interacting protein ZapD
MKESNGGERLTIHANCCNWELRKLHAKSTTYVASYSSISSHLANLSYLINRNTVVIIRRTEECVIRRIRALNGGMFSSNGEERQMGFQAGEQKVTWS